MGNNRLFKKREKSNIQTDNNIITSQELSEIAQQVSLLRDKIKANEQEKIILNDENKKLLEEKKNLEATVQRALKNEKNLQSKISETKEKITNLENESGHKQNQIIQFEKNSDEQKLEQEKLIQSFNEELNKKQVEINNLLQAKESVKSEVADVVLELHDHFDEKLRLLEEERTLLNNEKSLLETHKEEQLAMIEDMKKASQEEWSQEIQNAKGTAEQIIAEAEEKAVLLEAEGKDKVAQIKDRIAYYNHQLEEISKVISQIMSSIQ